MMSPARVHLRDSRAHGVVAPILVLALALVVGACSGGSPGSPGTPILANPLPAAPVIAERTAPPPVIADPLPVVLPRDDGPHDRLTEWWYYTGHLRADDGSRYGFEFVIFRAERGRFPTSWVSHLAITDETGDRFVTSQRLEIGPQVDRSPRRTTASRSASTCRSRGSIRPDRTRCETRRGRCRAATGSTA